MQRYKTKTLLQKIPRKTALQDRHQWVNYVHSLLYIMHFYPFRLKTKNDIATACK